MHFNETVPVGLITYNLIPNISLSCHKRTSQNELAVFCFLTYFYRSRQRYKFKILHDTEVITISTSNRSLNISFFDKKSRSLALFITLKLVDYLQYNQ